MWIITWTGESLHPLKTGFRTPVYNPHPLKTKGIFFRILSINRTRVDQASLANDWLCFQIKRIFRTGV